MERDWNSDTFYKSGIRHKNGGLAQLARALDLHSRGQGFDSLILHQEKKESYVEGSS